MQEKEEFKSLSNAEDLDIKTLSSLLSLLEEYEHKITYGGHLNWFEEGTKYGIDRLPKHRAFFEAGKDYVVRCAFSANRVGKTVAAIYEAVCHATGEYPSWWNGYRFNRPIKVWLVGLNWPQVREVLQTKVLGQMGQRGTGMIAEDKIVGTTAASGGVSGAVDSIEVKHVSGRNSIIMLKSCEQKIKGFQGAEVDFIVIDEEAPYDIFNECFLRLATTRGKMVLMMTLQNGLTEFVAKVYATADLKMGADPLPESAMSRYRAENKNQETPKFEKVPIAIFQWSMYDAPWLDKEFIAHTIATTPAHLLPARVYGKVHVGTGTVFPIDVDKLIVKPFEIPSNWKRVFGMDADWQRTAVQWGAIDPDTDIVYIYSEHYSEQREPLFHAEAIRKRGSWIVGNLDFAANRRSHIDGKRLCDIYRNYGLQLVNAEKARIAGISVFWERMATGRLKIFSTCTNLLAEIPIYRTDEKGEIVKEHDDNIDAARYMLMGLHHAKLPPAKRSSSVQALHKEYKW